MNAQVPAVRISVLTATRNCGAALNALYESLERQTYRRFEWIVMDGLSEDGTPERLRAYAQESPWVRVTSEHDFGLYDALNKAIQAATGEYYVVCNSNTN
jgi:glycosyltransferase involved in cell wall biosynthesis